jgi:hypothetical protein
MNLPGLFAWFDAKEVDEFADTLSALIIQQFPISEIQDPKRKGKARWERVHKAIFARAAGFAATKPLNIYKKARLANRFKWSLVDAGYPKDFADSVSYELVRFVALGPDERKKFALSRQAKS